MSNFCLHNTNTQLREDKSSQKEVKKETFEYQRLKKLNAHLAKSLQAKKHTEMEERSSKSRFKQNNNIPLADLTFRAPNN